MNLKTLFFGHIILNKSYIEILLFYCGFFEKGYKPEEISKIRKEFFGVENIKEAKEGQVEKYFMYLCNVDYYTLTMFKEKLLLYQATVFPEILNKLTHKGTQ